MGVLVNKKGLVLAISSRALFNLDDSHKIFEAEGLEAFAAYQREHENDLLEPGPAFHLVKKLLNLNTLMGEEHIEVLLLSRNTYDTGMRIFNSIQHYGLDVVRAAFTGGYSPYKYAKAFNADLLLSLNVEDVRCAINEGMAAAVIYHPANLLKDREDVRIAFDGDSVLFSDESERVHHESGLDAFHEHEVARALEPLNPGPFKSVIEAIQLIQNKAPGMIRTALVTARSAPAHKRVIHTLRTWNVKIDEALFLGGMDKTEFLDTFGADIFFDDQKANCDRTSAKVTTGHVPYGIKN